MNNEVDAEDLPDYEAIKIPEGKAPSEYNYNERRAELLKIIREKGDPDAIDHQGLANRYDVTPPTISKDKKRITAYIAHNLDPQKARAFSDSAYRKCIRELMDQGEFGKATRALDSWNDWLADEGLRSSEPERVEGEIKLTDLIGGDAD